jgi:hypothetical protein
MGVITTGIGLSKSYDFYSVKEYNDYRLRMFALYSLAVFILTLIFEFSIVWYFNLCIVPLGYVLLTEPYTKWSWVNVGLAMFIETLLYCFMHNPNPYAVLVASLEAIILIIVAASHKVVDSQEATPKNNLKALIVNTILVSFTCVVPYSLVNQSFISSSITEIVNSWMK